MQQEIEELKSFLKSNDFLEWCGEYIFPYLSKKYVKEDYYDTWNNLINNREPINKENRTVLRWLEEMPRGASKSLLLTECLTIFDACTGKYELQAIGAGTNGQTKERADNIKRWMLSSPYLRAKFIPDSIAKLDFVVEMSVSNTQWNNDKIVLKNGAVIYFRSMQQEWSGLHVQKAILDDPIAKKESKLSDLECIRTFEYDIIPTLKAHNADLIVILTPVRLKDLGRHIKTLNFFIIHSYKAINDFERFKKLANTIFLINKIYLPNDFIAQCRWLMKNQNFEFNKGKEYQNQILSLCLSKKRFGWKGYMLTYAEQGKRAFQREYLLNIANEENSVIERKYIDLAKQKGLSHRYYTENAYEMAETITVWDFSFSKNQNADKTACILMFKDREHKIGIQLLWSAKPNEYENWKTEIITRMKHYHNLYNGTEIIIEANSILQLTEDIKKLNLPLKPIWTGASDTSAKKNLTGQDYNFANMHTIDKQAAIARLGTAFENQNIFLVYGDTKAKETSDELADELMSWQYDENNKIIESSLHPDAGICAVLGYSHLSKPKINKIVGKFFR